MVATSRRLGRRICWRLGWRSTRWHGWGGCGRCGKRFGRNPRWRCCWGRGWSTCWHMFEGWVVGPDVVASCASGFIDHGAEDIAHCFGVASELWWTPEGREVERKRAKEQHLTNHLYHWHVSCSGQRTSRFVLINQGISSSRYAMVSSCATHVGVLR